MAQPVRQRIAALLLSGKRFRRYLLALLLLAAVISAGVYGELVQGATALTKSSDSYTYRDYNPAFPKQDFEEAAGDILVTAKAPRGAFPAGTTMHVVPVDSPEFTDAVMSAAPGVYDQIAAVDVTFIDPNGQEIQPLVPITITMTNTANPGEGGSVVLHVDDKGQATVVTSQDAPTPTGEVAFETNSFSVYIMAVKKLQQTLTASDGRTYDISVTYTEDAGIPEDAELVVREVTENDSNYAQVFNRAKDAATSEYDDATVASARFFDISIMKDGVHIEPLAPVEVNIVLASGIESTESTSVVHFTNSRKVEVVDAAVTSADAETETGVDVTFTTESFSIFGVIEMKIEKTVLASDGNNYKITVTYGQSAGVPAGATLEVTELLPEDEASGYDDYLAEIGSTLGWGGADPTYARLFDIKIVDRAGNKVELAAPVNVTIELADKATTTETQVMHFADGMQTPDVVESASVEGEVVSFPAESFSVYAIVDAPEPIGDELWDRVTNVSELADHLADGVYIHHPLNYYLTNQISSVKDATGITKTNTIASVNEASDVAGRFYFSPVAGSSDKFYIYCLDSDGNPQYVKRGGQTKNDLLFVDEDEATAFTVEAYPKEANTFRIVDNGYYWNMWGGNNGKIFAAYNKSDTNVRLQFEYYNSDNADPYGLDGKTYGIAYHNDRASAGALMAKEKDDKHLVATDMVMRQDVIDNDGILLVAANSDITDWTFHNEYRDCYSITAQVDGQTKYLSLNGQALTLSDEKTENCILRFAPGTGENAGKFRLINDAYSIELNLSGSSTDKGFWGTSSNSVARWLNLVERSKLNDDDFRLYTAQKVSVSDTENLVSGKKVIVYTRVWNDTKKRYEFFAVDADGSLIKAYDTGDRIEWTGSAINTALWEFTEHFNTDGTPSYYYELTNTQYGTVIAPQLAEGTITSPTPVGVNLNGRRFGENYTTIIAWDDTNYAYSGLKVENGRVVPCALAEADDFYFAIINPTGTDDQLSTVTTVDNDDFGITMKMVDYNNAIRQKNGSAGNNTNGRDELQTQILGYDTNVAGLLETQLGKDGYPLTNPKNTGQEQASLSKLYQGTVSANHLFLQSIYNESGYFEYDSTQNFAHFNDDGTFTVYDQLGTLKERINSGNHGQFMPYNDLKEGVYSDVTNETDLLDQELPDTDPRKGEKLYSVGARKNQADYFFGMEMEASFTQTASGLDAWGHDIIFEFSGDDDFWLYVDGELLLDLGGVHRAMSGSVNFRTGVITMSDNRGTSTIYDTFKANYKARGLSEKEISKKLAEKFEQNEDGAYVFKDYSNHDMKIFYMERGAGASNLHMRFNLAAVKPGTFTLSKALSGTESPSNNLIEFPYQIWYESKLDAEEHLLSDPSVVTYQGTKNQVTYRETFTPQGGTEAYDSVFMLRPGEVAEVDLPDDALNYRVVEVGVNTGVYDQVKANGTTLKGTGTKGCADRKDYSTSSDTMENRAKVDFVNNVAEGAMRSMTITKKLYDADGETVLSYPANQTTFTFRLYLGSENADPNDLPLAYLYAYLVKDGEGNYCSWDVENQSFAPVMVNGAPTKDYDVLKGYLDTLTDAEKEAIIFSTSPNGSISRIPAGFTIEVHDLIAGTQFKVEERDSEIPKGYTLRLGDGYQRTDEGHEQNTQTTPISGTMKVDETPAVLVSNQKGWGLTVQKVWTDKDFMETHDPIYFAVYVQSEDASGEETLTLLDGSVRKVTSPATEVYYFFGNLQSIPFDKYVIREVNVAGGTADASGVVTGYSSVTPIDDGGTLVVGGKPVGGSYDSGYSYKVAYTVGEQTTQNENVRTDTVTNSRPGIKLVKTDMSGTPLAGAKFTLKDSDGKDVAAASYTSDTDGKITIAYLSAGTYTLSETSAPKSYVAIPSDVTIKVDADGKVMVNGPDGLYEVDTEPSDGMTAVVTVKNRGSSFLIKKRDADNPDQLLEGAHFALYQQVVDDKGNPVKDNKPLPGYSDLVTDKNGVLEKIDLGLGARTYYLQETQAPEGYDPLGEDLVFTIGEDGTVSVPDGQRSWLSSTTDSVTGAVSYAIAIPNGKVKKVSFKKVDVSAPDTSALAGAEFDLYAVVDGQQASTPMFTGLTSGKDGLLATTDGVKVFQLSLGTYHLVETKAPDGYNLKSSPVVVTVTADLVHPVAYDEGTSISAEARGVTFDEETRVYTLKVSNTSGYELPESGGPGTVVFTLAGTMLVAAGAMLLVLRRRDLI